jgi:hypothetical protein
MDASRTLRAVGSASIGRGAPIKLGQTAAGSLLGLLALGGLTLCARRASGALIEPLRPEILIALGLVLALAAMSFRASLPEINGMGDRKRLYLAWAAPSAVLLLWLIGLTVEGTSGSGWLGLCGLALAEEAWSWRRLPQPLVAPVAANSAPRGTPRTAPSDPISSGLALHLEPNEPLEAISQQISRLLQEDGSESIEGWIRVAFEPGQRSAAAHLAICPPLDRLPECFAEQMEGLAAQVKIGLVLPYGVRFEVKLDEPAEEAGSVIVEFSVQEPAEGE